MNDKWWEDMLARHKVHDLCPLVCAHSLCFPRY
jgi:hypothetical protein